MLILANSYLKTLFREAKNECETLSEELELVKWILDLGWYTRPLFETYLKKFKNNPRLAAHISHLKKIRPSELERALKLRSQFQKMVSQKWQRSNLKVLIAPVLPHSILNKENVLEQQAMLEYTIIWSCLGFPCATMPITNVRESEQYFSDHFNDAWTKTLAENSSDSFNSPISVQIVGYPCEDERVLAISKLLQETVNYYDINKEKKLSPLTQPQIQEELERRTTALQNGEDPRISGTGARVSKPVGSGRRTTSSGANGDLRKRVSEGSGGAPLNLVENDQNATKVESERDVAPHFGNGSQY